MELMRVGEGWEGVGWGRGGVGGRRTSDHAVDCHHSCQWVDMWAFKVTRVDEEGMGLMEGGGKLAR